MATRHGSFFFPGIVIVLFASLLAFMNSESFSQEALSTESVVSEASLSWEEVPTEDMKAIIQLLATQTKSNYEKILSWQGVIHQEYSFDLHRSQARDLVEGMQDTPVRELHQETCHFAIDFQEDKRFVSKEDGQVTWLNKETGLPIKADNRTVIVNERFFITPNYYVRFDPNQDPAIYKVVQDHPNARQKRAAFREVRESSGADFYTDICGDPRKCFGIDANMHFWTYLDMYTASLKGKGRRGSEGTKLLLKNLKFHKASSPVGSWYREDVVLEGPGGGSDSIVLRTIWSPEAGLYPVKFNSWLNKVGGKPIESIQWKFEQVADVWVPTLFHKKEYANGGVSRERTLLFSDVDINKPIPSSQFGYSSLGLKDGDLLMDRIDDVCYIMKGGLPEKLADFNEKYSPPADLSSVARSMFLYFNIAFFVALAVILARRRARSRERS